ncbi:hypothetical protein IJ00_12720 [Calothrix sp. 336/3]|nr:hypothetical protein IJ00_12720 [Calothrix sp. 336/3]
MHRDTPISKYYQSDITIVSEFHKTAHCTAKIFSTTNGTFAKCKVKISTHNNLDFGYELWLMTRKSISQEVLVIDY